MWLCHIECINVLPDQQILDCNSFMTDLEVHIIPITCNCYDLHL